MRSGFSLIELIVAIFMAAIVSLSLFQLLSQTRKTVSRINSVIDADIPFMAFCTQLEKDATGMFAPASSIRAFAAQEKSKKAEEGKEEKPQKKEPEKEKAIENVFYLDTQKDQFFWSFITTGGLQLLEADGTVQLQPSMFRVAYILEKDPQRPEVSRLMYRFSAQKLEVNDMKAPDFYPSYELLTGIKQFELELTLFESVPQGEEKERRRPKPARIKEWNAQEIWQKYKSLIPAFVTCRGRIVDKGGREYPFESMHRVYAYNPYKEKEAGNALFKA